METSVNHYNVSRSSTIVCDMRYSLNSSREVDSINSEFTKCTHFLVTLLNKVIKRGSFPHCKNLVMYELHMSYYPFIVESLAFSIASLEVGIHKQTIEL